MQLVRVFVFFLSLSNLQHYVCAVKCKLNRLGCARSKKVEFRRRWIRFFFLLLSSLRWCVIVEIAFCSQHLPPPLPLSSVARRRRSEAEEENIYVYVRILFLFSFFSIRFGSYRVVDSCKI